MSIFPADRLRISPAPRTSGNSPRTFTWNLESETSIRKNVTLRLSYYETHTDDLFLVNPILPAPGTLTTTGLLALENTGTAHYRQAQATARYSPNEKAEVNVSYTWSRARGDLNTLSDTFIPFQIPVIRPNVYGVQPSDIPNRLLAWGFVHLPFWSLVFSPVFDHALRLCLFERRRVSELRGRAQQPAFSDLLLARRESLPRFSDSHSVQGTPDGQSAKNPHRRVFLDVTNRQNPHDVYSNVASPIFGQFAGFQRRFTGLAFGLGE